MSFHYEPISNVDEEYIKNCSPLELLKGMHDNHRTTYDNHIFAQKDIHMARQFSGNWCIYNGQAGRKS